MKILSYIKLFTLLTSLVISFWLIVFIRYYEVQISNDDKIINSWSLINNDIEVNSFIDNLKPLAPKLYIDEGEFWKKEIFE